MYPICLLLSKMYQSVTLAIPDGASYIQFTSEESTNTSGYRIDNVSLTGIAK